MTGRNGQIHTVAVAVEVVSTFKTTHPERPEGRTGKTVMQPGFFREKAAGTKKKGEKPVARKGAKKPSHLSG